mmetsp:Transcript_25872/g.65223  ORF Transcript_25872/g.65223 Transcript_25872/m.65223 type:complete len:365 (+) Transcript_25872:4434-5528(+)
MQRHVLQQDALQFTGPLEDVNCLHVGQVFHHLLRGPFRRPELVVALHVHDDVVQFLAPILHRAEDRLRQLPPASDRRRAYDLLVQEFAVQLLHRRLFVVCERSGWRVVARDVLLPAQHALVLGREFLGEGFRVRDRRQSPRSLRAKVLAHGGLFPDIGRGHEREAVTAHLRGVHVCHHGVLQKRAPQIKILFAALLDHDAVLPAHEVRVAPLPTGGFSLAVWCILVLLGQGHIVFRACQQPRATERFPRQHHAPSQRGVPKLDLLLREAEIVDFQRGVHIFAQPHPAGAVGEVGHAEKPQGDQIAVLEHAGNACGDRPQIESGRVFLLRRVQRTAFFVRFSTFFIQVLEGLQGGICGCALRFPP